MPGSTRRRGKMIGKRFYAYSTLHNAVAANASDTQTVTIASDSDFYLSKMTMFAHISGAVQTDSSRVLPLATVTLTEISSGNQMFDSAIPIPAVFGDGQIPFILPHPKLFEAKSALTVNVANFSAATTYTIYLNFLGYRVYYAN